MSDLRFFICSLSSTGDFQACEEVLKKKIITVLGARPQFIKASVLSNLLKRLVDVEEIIVNSGQHYDYNMSEQFFSELNIPKPTYNLSVKSSSHTAQTAAIMKNLEPILDAECPDMVLVYGDTNTTLAAALTAAQLNFPVAHIEAGLRSYRKGMAEEMNRVLTDKLSDYLFCTSLNSCKNLQSENIKNQIFMVGDVMYDAFNASLARTNQELILREFGLERNSFYFVTFHRAENVDEPTRLRKIVQGLSVLANGKVPVIVALHPRTKKSIQNLDLNLGRSRIVDPLPHAQTIVLLRNASAVITDSGGLQKEAYFAETPCLTIRDETEWVETLEKGHNRLLSPEKCERLVDVVSELQSSKLPKFSPIYGNGDAGEKICQHLRDILSV